MNALWTAVAIAAAMSLARMFAAYVISAITALILGVVMARNRHVEALLLPVLDILQSIPILGFFPVAMLIFIKAFGPGAGAEISSIVLIATSLLWNMIFGVYSALKSLDPEYEVMLKVYNVGPLTRFFAVYAPASYASLLANSLISWAGGWFFLTSAEIMSVGQVTYKLVGLGSLIVDAQERGDELLFNVALATLMAVIVASYLLIWNPVTVRLLNIRTLPGLVYTEKLLELSVAKVWRMMAKAMIRLEGRLRGALMSAVAVCTPLALYRVAFSSSPVGIVQELVNVGSLFLGNLPLTVARVYGIVALSLVLSLFAAYAAYNNERVAWALNVLGELLSSVPAPLWWAILAGIAVSNPILVMFVVLFQGAFWYTYFNVLIFGIPSMRQEIIELSRIYGVRGRLFLRHVFVPMLMPAILAGTLSASGGAWNATIVAEYFQAGQEVIDLGGVGALLDKLNASGDVLGLIISLVYMSIFIVIVNNLLFKRLFSRISGRFSYE
ncbi:MAG: ABC transporter permease subunit [Desulfurococcaceae archaeon]